MRLVNGTFIFGGSTRVPARNIVVAARRQSFNEAWTQLNASAHCIIYELGARQMPGARSSRRFPPFSGCPDRFAPKRRAPAHPNCDCAEDRAAPQAP